MDKGKRGAPAPHGAHSSERPYIGVKGPHRSEGASWRYVSICHFQKMNSTILGMGLSPLPKLYPLSTPNLKRL